MTMNSASAELPEVKAQVRQTMRFRNQRARWDPQVAADWAAGDLIQGSENALSGPLDSIIQCQVYSISSC